MLKRFLTAVLVVAAIVTPHVAQAKDHEQQRKECKFQWMDNASWTQREEDATARCVTNRWPLSGGLMKLRAVGQCESGWNRFAYNGGGPYVGLFQHALSSWYSRVNSYEPAHWDLKSNWRNSRSQIVVTVRMVRAVGWGPWSCA